MDLAELFAHTEDELRALLSDPARAAEWQASLHQRIMARIEGAQARVPTSLERVDADLVEASPKLIYTVPIRVDSA